MPVRYANRCQRTAPGRSPRGVRCSGVRVRGYGPVRSWREPIVSPGLVPRVSTAVAHTGVLHPEDLRVLGEEKVGIDDFADEERVPTTIDRLGHPAIDEADRLIEDRGARRSAVHS